MLKVEEGYRSKYTVHGKQRLSAICIFSTLTKTMNSMGSKGPITVGEKPIFTLARYISVCTPGMVM